MLTINNKINSLISYYFIKSLLIIYRTNLYSYYKIIVMYIAQNNKKFDNKLFVSKFTSHIIQYISTYYATIIYYKKILFIIIEKL